MKDSQQKANLLLQLVRVNKAKKCFEWLLCTVKISVDWIIAARNEFLSAKRLTFCGESAWKI